MTSNATNPASAAAPTGSGTILDSGKASDPTNTRHGAILQAKPRALCVCGVDPGGAVAFYWPIAPDRINVDDMPKIGGYVDCHTLAARVSQMMPDVAYVETASARPGQGVSSCFKYGAGYGAVLAIFAALQVRTVLVTPSTWKKHFRLDSDKEKSRALALRSFPKSPEHFSRKRDHNRAEASLLAFYGASLEFPNSRFPGAASSGKSRRLNRRAAPPP